MVGREFNMDRRGECSWLSHDDLDILEEHSHSPLLVYSAVHLRGIAHYSFRCIMFMLCLLMDMDLEAWIFGFWRVHLRSVGMFISLYMLSLGDGLLG